VPHLALEGLKMSNNNSKTLQEVLARTSIVDEASLMDKFKNLWKKNPSKQGNNDPTLPDPAAKNGQSDEKAVNDLADKLNIELVKGKYPHPGATALKDPEVIRLMTIFGKEMLKGTTGGGANIESLKKMMLDDPTSAINMMLYHVSVKARPFQRTGLDPKTPISLFTGIDDDKKENFKIRLTKSLMSRKRSNIDSSEVEKVVMDILTDLEAQLKINDFVVQEKVSRKKRKARTAKLRNAAAVKRPAVEKLSAGEFVAQNSTGERKKFHQQQFGTGAGAQQQAKEAAKTWARLKKGEPIPPGIEGLKRPEKEPVQGPTPTAKGGMTPPQKGVVNVGRAVYGKIKTSGILKTATKDQEKQHHKEILKIVKSLGIPWLKKHIGARGQLKNIKLKEQTRLFENTLSRLLAEGTLPVNNLSGEKLAGFIEDINKFYPYAQEYLKFDRPTSLNLISDPSNSKDTFGKTAYYNPGNEEITIFVDKRHPKDMLRSFSHELVHHAQNCRGEFDRDFVAGENYIETDDHLKEMEREAYEKGNMCLRTYESYLKKENQK
jgi:hypothetical protein